MKYYDGSNQKMKLILDDLLIYLQVMLQVDITSKLGMEQTTFVSRRIQLGNTAVWEALNGMDISMELNMTFIIAIGLSSQTTYPRGIY